MHNEAPLSETSVQLDKHMHYIEVLLTVISTCIILFGKELDYR